MCETKELAGTKIDRLIASMDRLSAALEGTFNFNPGLLPRAIPDFDLQGALERAEGLAQKLRGGGSAGVRDASTFPKTKE